MNPELKTTEYVSKLKDIKLSDSARTRIADNLQAYASFHAVRGGEESRFISEVPATASTSLLSLRYSFMPLMLILAVVIGGSTTFAAQTAVPGDFLYPVKTEFNENIRTAFAFSADSEAKVHTALLEERIEEAQTLQAEGRLTAETATEVSTAISNQFAVATEASAKSSEKVAAEINWRLEKAMTTYLALGGDTTTIATIEAGDAAIASESNSDISMSMRASDLATGLYSITAYQADMKARTTALKNIIVKHQSKLSAAVYTEVTAKITTATTLTTQAETQAEADARLTLEKAATLAGEVEATLSTLGQVEIDPDTGIIADIDFSIDPMKIDRGDGEGSTSSDNRDQNAKIQGGASIDSTTSTELLDTTIESNSSVTSDVEVGL
ncbi:MAG: DUF5667 domain-containing protein [Patescibacteria group bacterium]